MIPQNLGQLFRDTVSRFPDKKAVYFKEGGEYRSFSWSELSEKVDAAAQGLLRHGLKPGERIAILSENRPEWAIVDLAAQSIGAATVPIYPSLTSAEIEYILSDSGARLVALSSSSQFEKMIPIQKSLPLLCGVIAFDAAVSLAKDSITVPLFILKDLFKEDGLKVDIASVNASIRADAIASIIYTSGTTGVPKGVMLTHLNFIRNAVLSKEALNMSESDHHLSFLPLCHVFERLAGYYLMIYIGASIAYAENLDAVPRNLLETKPTFIMGVPRFYEKIKDRVLEAVDAASSVRKGLFYWARDLGAKKRLAVSQNGKKGVIFHLQCKLAEKLVYGKFKARLGGRVRFCISGGAALSREIAEFFSDLGVMIYEGYGLTETSPVISVNREGRYKFGTVGIPLEGVEVQISEEGEVLTKSPCVMKGYFNKPEETAAVLKEGWFYTGDLGHLDKEGFLAITGRKKELIVTSGGKKVAPQPIEEAMQKDPLIVRCVLFGEGKKFLTALVIPRKEKILEYAKEQKIACSSYAGLLKDALIYKFIERHIEECSQNLANFEKIKYFCLLENDFSQSAGELTPTLKVKREVVLARYRSELERFYNQPHPV